MGIQGHEPQTKTLGKHFAIQDASNLQGKAHVHVLYDKWQWLQMSVLYFVHVALLLNLGPDPRIS